MKKATAKSIVATISRPALSATCLKTRLKIEPAENIASAAMAGLAMRLVQRLEVRHEPTAASPEAASAAAPGP